MRACIQPEKTNKDYQYLNPEKGFFWERKFWKRISTKISTSANQNENSFFVQNNKMLVHFTFHLKKELWLKSYINNQIITPRFSILSLISVVSSDFYLYFSIADDSQRNIINIISFKTTTTAIAATTKNKQMVKKRWTFRANKALGAKVP